MITDALDTIRILGWAFAGWLLVFAAAGTLVVLTITAAVAYTARALWKRTAAPSWARSRLRARIHARTRTRRPSGRTDDPGYEEVA